MPFTKKAHEEALKKVAAVDQRDAENAIDAGFAIAARDMGLDQARTAKLAAVAKQKVAAAQAVRAAKK